MGALCEACDIYNKTGYGYYANVGDSKCGYCGDFES